MKTYALEHVLRKKLAYVPGSVSNIGRLLLVISLESPAAELKSPSPAAHVEAPAAPQTTGGSRLPAMEYLENNANCELTDDLAVALNYYAQLFRFNEILEFNVLAVIDNRCGNWKRLRFALKLIKIFLPQIAVALVVKSDQASTPLNVKLWLNRTRPLPRRTSLPLCGASSGDTTGSDHGAAPGNGQAVHSAMAAIRPSTVLLVGASKLTTYVNQDQIPAQFGGRFASYNHASWLIGRIAAERFVDRVEDLISRRFEIESASRAEKHCVGDWRVRHLISEASDEPEEVRCLIDLGNRIAANLAKQSAAKLNVDLTSSVQMAITSLEPLTLFHGYSKIYGKPKSKQRIDSQPKVKLYGSKAVICEMPLDRREIEAEIDAIRRWLANDGDRLIMCETDVGNDLRAAERLVDKHELLELDCAETFARYARLSSALDMLPADAALATQRAELDSAIRTFAMRVDRRRTLLLIGARFFRLLKKSRAAVNVVSQILSQAGEDDDGLGGCMLTDKQQANLETNKSRAEILGAKTFEEGARFVQMLAAGTGRADIVRDYSKEIGIVVKSSEVLATDLEAMEQVFGQPEPVPQPGEDERKPSTADSLDATSSSSSSGLGHQSGQDSLEDQVNQRRRKAKQTLTPLITGFVNKLEQQLVVIAGFVRKFSKELETKDGATADCRKLLKKYQGAYFQLERQWSTLNACGLDFVAELLRAQSYVEPSSLAKIENGMLELNRQFSRVRTLWKDVQINKVQSDIVKLLDVCARRSTANWKSSSISVSRANNKSYVDPNRLSPASDQSSGLPSSLSSSPGQLVSKASSASDSPPYVRPAKSRELRQHFRNEPPRMKRSFTSSDVSQLSPVKEHQQVADSVEPPSPPPPKWLSNPELHLTERFV